MKALPGLILILSGSLGLLGCRIAEEKIFGRYTWWPHHDIGIIVKLDSSHRFKLFQLRGNVLKRGEGEWYSKGRRLILQSDSGQNANYFIRFDQAIWKIKVKNDSVCGVHDGSTLLEKVQGE